MRRMSVFFSVFVLAGLAGLRDYTVGTDVLGYGVSVFQEAHIHHSYFDYSTQTMLRMESGYLMLNFLVSRITGDFHLMLFLLMFMQIFFIENGLLYFRKKIPVIYGFATFVFFYFSPSLNIMRQMLALAIIFYAFRFVIERKKLLFLLWVAIASLFHISAWCAAFIYPVYAFLAGRKSLNWTYMSVFFFIAGMLCLQQFIGIVLSLIGLPSKYSYYFSYATHGIFITKFLMSLPFFLLFICLRRKLFNKTEPLNYFLMFCACMLVVNTQAREWIGNHAERLLIYFSFFHILALPQALQTVDRKNYVNTALAFTGYMMVYWYYYFIYNGFEGTMPYTSLIFSHWI